MVGLQNGIIAELETLKHPDDPGRSLLTRIAKREEVFDGPYAHFAPDILFTFDEGGIISDDILAGSMFEKSNWFTGTGTHRLEGLLIARGPGIREDVRVDGARIFDVAPTILHSMGLPVPTDMSGRVLTELFTDDFLEGRPIEYAERDDSDERADETVYSSEEEELVKERLRNLGYIE